jgi:hypothetical protein
MRTETVDFAWVSLQDLGEWCPTLQAAASNIAVLRTEEPEPSVTIRPANGHVKVGGMLFKHGDSESPK